MTQKKKKSKEIQNNNTKKQKDNKKGNKPRKINSDIVKALITSVVLNIIFLMIIVFLTAKR